MMDIYDNQKAFDIFEVFVMSNYHHVRLVTWFVNDQWL